MDIQLALNDLMKQHRNDVDEWMIELFGSIEAAKAAARYFVIEEKPMRHSVEQRPQDAYLTYSISVEYRLRPKTPEELSHDRAEEILAMNTREDPLCIVCKETITPNDTLVDTIHGKFHGFPKTCVDGHPD